MVLVGIGSRVCSRNSSMCGLTMVSSGMLCKVIQANRAAFLLATFRGMPATPCGDIVSSGKVFDS